MNLQQLRYARAIYECGSFVEAAKVCAVAQPTLSNGLVQLEADLGQALFNRTTRSVKLTEFGQLILPCILDVLNSQAALVAKAQSLNHPARQVIRIGISPIMSIKIVGMIADAFREINRDVEIIFREINLTEMFRLLEIGQLEFVFGPIDPDAKHQADWNSLTFLEEPLLFVGSGKGIINNGRVSLKNIAEETFIMVPDTCGLARITRGTFRRHRLKLKEYAGEAMSYSVLQNWAQLGIGTAILPASKVSGENYPRIVEKQHGPELTIAYGAYWRVPTGKSTAINQFATFLNAASASIAMGMQVNGGQLGSSS